MDRPLKIVHVVLSFQTGGLETLVLELCARVACNGGPLMMICGPLPGDGFHSDKIPAIEKELRQYLGDEVRLHFEMTGHIPVTGTGKFQYMKSAVPIRFGMPDDSCNSCTHGRL